MFGLRPTPENARSTRRLALAAFLGLAAGVAAERLYGITAGIHRRTPAILPQAAQAPARGEDRRPADMYTVGAAGHSIYVRQYAPEGFQRTNLTSHAVEQQTPQTLINRLEPGLRPLPVQEIGGRIAAKRELIEQTPGAWNAETVALRQVEVSRTGTSEDPVLNLGFAKSDYASFQVIASAWEEHAGTRNGRQPAAAEMLDVLPGLSNSFGINLTIETADGQLLLTTRSAKTASAGNLRHISVNEGMSVADEDPAIGAPDPYRTAVRGIEEELGAQLGEDLQDRIVFHSLICDVARYEWALLGHVNLAGTEWTSDAFLDCRKLGMAADSWESNGLQFIPMTAASLQDALADDSDWIGHGYLNLLFSAVHRFKTERPALLKAARTALGEDAPLLLKAA